MSTQTEQLCVICKLVTDQPIARLYAKGCQSLQSVSKAKGDQYDFVPGQFVHQECRRLYCHPTNLQSTYGQHAKIDPLTSPRSSRSGEQRFEFESKCLFCGTNAKSHGKKRGSEVFPVRTFDFQKSIKTICEKRADEWSEKVTGRLEFAQDLPAVEARYHQSCSTNFRTGSNIPKQYQSVCSKSLKFDSDKKKKVGRPSNCEVDDAFKEVLQYFESNAHNQITICELVKKMTDICGNSAYSAVYMKTKVMNHYGTSVIVTELNGKQNVVQFKSTAALLLHSLFKRSGQDSENDKNEIIKTAAKLILSDIKSVETSNEYYPSASDVESLESNRKYVPESLQMFLKTILDFKNTERKVIAIGQAIIQAANPRGFIAPLQLGLGIQMHHHFGSKFLIEVLNSLGFCSSYKEIQKYETSAAATQGTHLETNNNHFVQFVADNVDHNTRTLDGHNTFHGMGIIAAITPALESKRKIPRISVTNEDLVAVGKINIQYYKQTTNAMEKMVFRKLMDLSSCEDITKECDFLLKLARPLKISLPGWSGIMQLVQQGSHHGHSSIVFLPMIDMNPSDMSCIYSTLKFVSTESIRADACPVITFDQPLYWKAMNIVENEADNSDIKKVIVRLGGFHTEMSFLGTTGRLMENSGLHELLETVYASNAVDNMLTGKAIARAVRGHLLVDDVLNTILLRIIFPSIKDDSQSVVPDNDIEVSTENVPELMDNITVNNSDDKINTTTIKIQIQDLMSKKSSAHNLGTDTRLKEISEQYEEGKGNFKENRTASLWLQYMEMIDILKTFIKAERTGNWKLHLKSVQDIMPFLAAAGHNLYLKSGYIYLQQMSSLEKTHPGVWNAFCEGYHVIRRSDRFWAGLSTDLVIEQVLMRSVKSVGGMTRGRGMNESQRAQWLLSMPACADMNNVMQTFTGSSYETSDQHKESYDARIKRDEKDRITLQNFIEERSPFTDDTPLRNIETGVTAEPNVNVDQAQLVGQKVIDGMLGEKVLEHSFKRSSQAKTLGTKNTLKVDGEEVHVDSQLLFQRLLVAADENIDNPEDLFAYELSSQPSSLFDTSGLLREAQKPALANAIWAKGQCGVDELPNRTILYVLDGGSLLHRIPWTYASTFDTICQGYTNLIERNYGTPIVVFDGYDAGPTTKDATHDRRAKGIKGTKVNFNGTTPFKTKKDIFLKNKENKQKFICLLTSHLEGHGCKVVQADSDADVLIAQTAVMSTANSTTCVVGEDTDILVLLMYHAIDNGNELFYTSDIKSGLKKKKIWDIIKTKKVLGEDQCRILPFIHGFTGCDTTSRIYGIGKQVAFKKLMTDEHLKKHADTFIKQSTKEEVIKAGNEAFLSLYNGTPNQDLDKLRYSKFITKVHTSKNVVHVQSIPPTSAAAQYHSLRTYLQVQTWIGMEMDPLEWGWCKNSSGDKFEPVKTNLPAGPLRLLQNIRCNCKINCESKRCNCRKHGLKCSSGCGDCRGTSCSNAPVITEEDLEY